MKLFNDAETMLKNLVNSGSLRCNGVVGFWRANSSGDDILLYDSDAQHFATFYGLRQQVMNEIQSLNDDIVRDKVRFKLCML